MRDTAGMFAALRSHAREIDEQVGGTSWYLFGSAMQSVELANDVDILVLCSTDVDADKVRRLIDVDLMNIPLDVSIFTFDEESEVGFIQNQGCIQIYPEAPCCLPSKAR